MLKSSEICLYLASFKGASGSVDAWVLRLEPKNVASAAETLIETRASVAAAAVTATVVHPDVKLPWFDRRPLSEIRRVPSHDILMKVRLAPCLYVDDEDEICVDGYLLSHGMYNFDLRGKNEKTVATPIALSDSRKFSSATSTSRRRRPRRRRRRRVLIVLRIQRPRHPLLLLHVVILQRK